MPPLSTRADLSRIRDGTQKGSTVVPAPLAGEERSEKLGALCGAHARDYLALMIETPVPGEML